LRDRLDAPERVLPRASRVTLRGQGHNAERTAPAQVADAIAGYLGRTTPRS
jgi:hypothetical protein